MKYANKYWKFTRNFLKIPAGGRLTSWLLTDRRLTVDPQTTDSRLTGAVLHNYWVESALWDHQTQFHLEPRSMIFIPRTSGLPILCPNHQATLPLFVHLNKLLWFTKTTTHKLNINKFNLAQCAVQPCDWILFRKF